MGIVTKLVKLGKHYGIVLNKSILELLDIDPNTSLEISTLDSKMLIIKPVLTTRATFIRSSFTEALDKVNSQYGSALQKLAGNEQEDS